MYVCFCLALEENNAFSRISGKFRQNPIHLSSHAPYGSMNDSMMARYSGHIHPQKQSHNEKHAARKAPCNNNLNFKFHVMHFRFTPARQGSSYSLAVLFSLSPPLPALVYPKAAKHPKSSHVMLVFPLLARSASVLAVELGCACSRWGAAVGSHMGWCAFEYKKCLFVRFSARRVVQQLQFSQESQKKH